MKQRRKLPDPTPEQLSRLAACLLAGRECAERMQPVASNKKVKDDSKTPFLCGFIMACTACARETARAVQGRLL